MSSPPTFHPRLASFPKKIYLYLKLAFQDVRIFKQPHGALVDYITLGTALEHGDGPATMLLASDT